MARIDITTDSAWMPEPVDGKVITSVRANSVVERVARRVNMTTRAVLAPRFTDSDVDVVPEATVIPEASPSLDEVRLEAVKFANRFRLSEEDLNDSLPGLLDQLKQGWASSFARKLDNAALGVTAEADGDDVPFNSVYHEVSTNAADNLIATAGDVTFENLSAGLATLETGDYFDPARMVVVAHPAFRGYIRNLKDESGTRVAVDPMNGEAGSIFGYSLVYSAGARTSATATRNPTGNPLLIAGNADHLILGVRSGPESQVSDVPNWETDEPELKMRARRGFAVADPTAFFVVERTNAA